MKINLFALVIWTILIVQTNFSQDVVVTLGGSTINQAFSVKNSIGDTLLRVRGDGSVGIGSSLPIGFCDIDGGTIVSGNGKDVNIFAQNTLEHFGTAGSINIKSGWSENYAGSINIETQCFPDFPNSPNEPGAINLITADNDITGDINLETGSGYGISGDIKLTTGSTEGWGGNIELTAGTGNDKAGNILLSAGYSMGGSPLYTAGRISLKGGNSMGVKGGDIEFISGNSSDSNGGDVIITSGNSTVMGNGGNVIINPGSGSTMGIDGTVIVNGSGIYSGTWTQSSDIRYKKNIRNLYGSIESLKKLKGVKYELDQDSFPEKNFESGTQIGMIAQDVEKVFPELVKTDSEGYKSIAYQNMVSILIEAFKEQQKQIEYLNEKVATLEKSIDKNKVELTSLNR